MDSTKLNILREEPTPCRLKLTVEVPQERVREAIKKAESEYKKAARIPGFRPGKAPRPLLLRHYGDSIIADATRQLLRVVTEEAVTQEEVKPETVPQIDNQDSLRVKDSESFVFTMAFDVPPNFELPAYKGLQIHQETAGIGDEDIQRVINELLESRTSYEKVERPAQAGDLLKATYHGTPEEGDEFPDSAKFLLDAEETWIALREPEILPGIAEALTGTEAGAHKQVAVVFPDEFYEPALAGKRIVYSVNVLEVHAAIVPELTDNLAQEIGADDAEDMRQRIKSNLQMRSQQQRTQSTREKLVAGLLEKVQFDLPPAMLARETYDIMLRLYQDMSRQGNNHQELTATQNELHQQAEQMARQSLKRRYLLNRIADEESINVETAEVSGMIQTLATYHRVPEKQMLRRLQESGRIVDLMESIRENKTVERLIELADVIDVANPPAGAVKE